MNEQDRVHQVLQRAKERDEEHDRFLKSIGQPTRKDTKARAMAGFEVLLAERDKWTGTWLVELNSRLDMAMTGCKQHEHTRVKGLELHGEYFTVHGEDFECGGAAECLSIIVHTDGIVEFSGYGGHTFWITNYRCEDEEEEEDEG